MTIVGLPPTLDVDRTLVMGVVNVTPDSFSDGGRWLDPAAAVQQGLDLMAAGADILDIGGESTRPGAGRVDPHDEVARILPVVHELVRAGAVVSIDTMRAEVADAALTAGARIVNDVSGGVADPAMAGLVAEAGVPFVLVHWRGPSDRMNELAHYDDVVTQVLGELDARCEALVAAGIEPGQIVLDPGLGFAKNAEHNWALLQRLDAFVGTGRPVLVAASRKRFLGSLLAQGSQPRPVDDREAGTAAISALAAGAGAWCVRVHQARASRDAVEVAAAWRRGSAS